MKPLLYSFLLLSSLAVQAQESDLFDVFEENAQSEVVYATFKGTQLINASTNETPGEGVLQFMICLLYTSPSPRDRQKSRMPSSA